MIPRRGSRTRAPRWLRRKRNEGNLVADLARGALAGVAATWLMGKFTTYLYEKEATDARRKEDEARGYRTAYGTAAQKTAAVFGRELSDDQRQRLGSALHWALGAGAGAAYGAMRRRVPRANLGNGLLYGTAFWAAVDEGANTALGLTPPPTAFPWQTHGRALAGHLVYGLAADTALRVLERD